MVRSEVIGGVAGFIRESFPCVHVRVGLTSIVCRALVKGRNEWGCLKFVFPLGGLVVLDYMLLEGSDWNRVSSCELADPGLLDWVGDWVSCITYVRRK